MTLDQIEDVRDSLRRGGDGQPSLSLQRAAQNVRLPFEQCHECNGKGWTKATLLASMTAIELLARHLPNEPVPIQYDRCPRCHGSGGLVVVKCDAGRRGAKGITGVDSAMDRGTGLTARMRKRSSVLR
jgi:hypothetical protein